MPKVFIGTFFSHLEETSLDYNIIEYDMEEDELIVGVEYSPDERDEVMNLIELLDEYHGDDDELSGEDEN